MRDFKFTCVQEQESNYGCSIYDVSAFDRRPYTVSEFISYVLSRQHESGSIEFVNPYTEDKIPRWLYNNGRMLKRDGTRESDTGGYDPKVLMTQTIAQIKCFGSWGSYDYLIALKYPSILRPLNKCEDPDQLPLVPALSKYKIKAQGAAKEEIDIWVKKIQEELASGDMTITIPVSWEISKDV